jgi:hypothetical protein
MIQSAGAMTPPDEGLEPDKVVLELEPPFGPELPVVPVGLLVAEPVGEAPPESAQPVCGTASASMHRTTAFAMTARELKNNSSAASLSAYGVS